MSKKTPNSTPPQNATTETKNDSSPASLKDLLTKGLAQTCTYSTDAGGGTIYVSGGKVRGDFETAVEGKSMKSHMIVVDNTSYIWTDDQKTGFKMSFDPNSVSTTGTANTSTSTQGGIDPAANYNYKCSAWITDSAQFDLPKGVTFTSFAAPAVTGGSGAPAQPAGSGSSQQCAYCNALSGNDKTQCLKALNCN